MQRTALIMAGGRGERFWPKSRRMMPKQFLSLTGDGKTMIQLTVERILPLVSIGDIYIVTNQDYLRLVREQLPDIPDENILCEPISKNTAPCIGLGAVHIAHKYGDAIMYVLPSDHLIKYNAMYQRALTDAAALAEKGTSLVTLGIAPSYPETSYGYIKYDPLMTEGQAFAVESFIEKPNLDTAKKYLSSEQYLWNSGIFIWKVSSILDKIKRFIPNLYDGVMRIKESIGKINEEEILVKEFSSFESESVDYGILEYADEIYVLACSFGWDDVGSWLAVERIQEPGEFGNNIDGKTITIDTKNTIIQGGKKLIAAVGIKDLIIIDSDDAILVCDKNSAGDIRKVLDHLRISDLNEYL